MSTPAEQVTTNIPSWLKEAMLKLVGQAQALTDLEKGGYQQYGGQRVAEFNPLQTQAFRDIAGMQVADQIRQATGLAGLAGLRAGELSRYTPAAERQFYQSPAAREMGVSYRDVAAPSATGFQMGPAERVGIGALEQYRMGAPQQIAGPAAYQAVSGPALQQFQMTPSQQVRAAELERLGMVAPREVTAQQLQQYRMAAPERVGAERFGLGAMQEYMSPYMRGVVEQQRRAAIEDYRRQLPGMGAAAARAGAKGGTREALLQAEAQRGLAERLGDIEATGLQSAYQQAQQQFGVDRAAQMQAALANQQAMQQAETQNLAAALQTQGLSAEQAMRAALANQQMGYQVGAFNVGAEQQRQQLMAQQQLEAQRLNQAAGLTVGQQNLAAQLQTQGLSSQQALEIARLNQQGQLSTEQLRAEIAKANQAAGMTAEQANQQAALQVQQLGTQSGLQAALANQQMGMQVGQQNLQAQINQAQFAAQQAMQAGQTNQAAQLQAQAQALQQMQALNQFNQQNAGQMAQYGLAGANLAEQSRQFGANLGLQGLQQQLAAAGQLGGLGMQQYQQQMGIGQAQLGAGGQMQALQQELLNQQYQDFINKQQFPYQQLEFMSGILRGLPASGQSQTMYQRPPSMFNQIAGLGLMGLGGLFGGAGGSGGTPAPSDRRLKSNVVRIGTHPLGIGVYEYDIWGLRQRGVMADEVMSVMPEAVEMHKDGYMAVRYDMIGGV